MNIIEKLEITKIKRYNGSSVKPSKLHNFVCVDPVILTDKEEVFNKMLDALIEVEKALEDAPGGWGYQNELMRSVIEKATGKTWEEIKELL